MRSARAKKQKPRTRRVAPTPTKRDAKRSARPPVPGFDREVRRSRGGGIGQAGHTRAGYFDDIVATARVDESDTIQRSPARVEEPPASTRADSRPSSVQRLKVGGEDTPQEREAERVAEAVQRRTTTGHDATSVPSSRMIQSPGDVIRRATSNAVRALSSANDEDSVKALVADQEVQRKSVGDANERDLDLEASRAVAERGPGRTMNAQTREKIESVVGEDLSSVRIHDDPRAQESTRRLDARAFTYGNDIWLGPGESDRDTRLMAHETAHVLQQGRSVNRDVVQRVPRKTTGALETGKLNPEKGTITFATIDIPKFKMADHRAEKWRKRRPYRRPRGERVERSDIEQRKDWLKKADPKKTLRNKLNEMMKGEDPSDPPALRVKLGRAHYQYYFGSINDIANRLLIPNWFKNYKLQNPREVHVDHIVEIQLSANKSGQRGKWVTFLSNMELLHGKPNRESGRAIRGAIESRIDLFNKTTENVHAPDASSDQERRRIIKDKYILVFKTAAGKQKPTTVGKDQFWTPEQIEAGEHISDKRRVALTTVSDIGGRGFVRIFGSAGGGQSKKFTWTGNQKTQNPKDDDERNWLGVLEIKKKCFRVPGAKVSDIPTGEPPGPNLGYLEVSPGEGRVFEFGNREDRSKIEIARIGGTAARGGIINKDNVKAKLRRLHPHVKELSPVHIETVDILGEQGLYIAGRIEPSVPLLKNAFIDFTISGRDVELSREFSVDEISLPKPFSIDACTLKVAYNSGRGLKADGRIDFGVEGLGTGSLTVATTSESFVMTGDFAFDSNVFETAEVSLTYENGELSGSGKLAVGERKIRGLKRASLDVSYAKDELSASGEAELAIKGVDKLAMSLRHNEEEGTVISGRCTFSDLPGIKQGELEATLIHGSDDGWSVSGSGKATLSIPGISSELAIHYDNGGLLIAGDIGYKRGRLNGNVFLGVTNYEIDSETGERTENVSDKIVVFGRGRLEVQVTPWLLGEAEVHVSPIGKLTIAGTLSVTKPIVLMDRDGKDWTLLDIDIGIPVAGIPHVASLNVGITGKLTAGFYIGPAQIDSVAVSVFYDPDDESKLDVNGTARFYMPAGVNVGSDLSVYAELEVAVVRVRASLGLGLGAGLAGELIIPVNANYNPSQGFSIDTIAEVKAKPELWAELYGDLSVALGKWRWWKTVWSKDLIRKRWELGSNLEFGVAVPVGYSEQDGFKWSADGATLTYPTQHEIEAEGRRLMDRVF